MKLLLFLPVSWSAIFLTTKRLTVHMSRMYNRTPDHWPFSLLSTATNTYTYTYYCYKSKKLKAYDCKITISGTCVVSGMAMTLGWFEHVRRRSPEAPMCSRVLRCNNNRKRGRGRPDSICKVVVKGDLKWWNISKDLALNRSVCEQLSMCVN